MEELRRCFTREGYFHLPAILPGERASRMLAAVETVRAAGWPPVFTFVYDEFWSVVR